VAADLMIILLSKALQLRNYFSADDKASLHHILLSSVHVSFHQDLTIFSAMGIIVTIIYE